VIVEVRLKFGQALPSGFTASFPYVGA
jgi:hypothetical protein